MTRFILFYSSVIWAIHGSATTPEYIQARESQVHKFAETIKKDGYSAQDFYQRIITPLDQGDEVDLTYMDQWEQYQSQFLELRLHTIAEKQWYFVHFVHHALNDVIKKQSPETRMQVRSDLTKIQELFDKWGYVSSTSFIEGVEQKKQRDRLYSFNDYFKEVSQLLHKLEYGPAPTQELSIPKLAALKVGTLVLGRNFFPSCAPTARKNCTPVTTEKGAAGFFKQWAQKEGIQIDFQGRENLSQIPLDGSRDGKTVNLFLPSHRSAVIDGMMMANLNLPHFLIFANPSAFLGYKFLANLLASLPEFIAVAGVRGQRNLTPIEKLLTALTDQLSPNVINYPQGFVSNAGEVLPIHGHFVEKLLCPLILEGFRVNIIPISYESDSELLASHQDHSRAKYTVKIHPPLFSKSVEKLVRMQLGMLDHSRECTKALDTYSRVLDHFLVSSWYESIIIHKELSLADLLLRAQNRLSIRFEDFPQHHEQEDYSPSL